MLLDTQSNLEALHLLGGGVREGDSYWACGAQSLSWSRTEMYSLCVQHVRDFVPANEQLLFCLGLLNHDPKHVS